MGSNYPRKGASTQEGVLKKKATNDGTTIGQVRMHESRMEAALL